MHFHTEEVHARDFYMWQVAPGSKLESGESTKKLMDSLLVVRPPSIARWNEHKDVKEDKEREPFFFGQKAAQQQMQMQSQASTAAASTGQQPIKKETLQSRFKKKTTVAALVAVQAASLQKDN